MAKKMALIRMLSSPDNKRVLQAVEELRVRGWLSDGSLAGVPLCHAHLQNADLLGADLRNVDLHQAHLQWADLSQANLSGSKLSRANLRGANLSQTNLAGVDLFKADLTEARNLADSQLALAGRLWGAIMPDEETYDGRFNLPGDLEFARWGRVDVADPAAMAQFFGVPLETYLHGQTLGSQTLAEAGG
ncbi:MAG: pentapeptide repeat-containing protein [Anaerolineales bacterium]|nr:pentapeptide repeat-containing protein [Anaerolineales bacterium]